MTHDDAAALKRIRALADLGLKGKNARVVVPTLGGGFGRKSKPDFVGKRSLSRPDMLKSSRKQLVGLRALDAKIVLEDRGWPVSHEQEILYAVKKAVEGSAEAQEVLCIPAVHMGSIEGLETSVVAFTTDIPAFNGSWGTPYLFGPGSIHVAHTSEERIPKAEITEAIDIYQRLVRRLIQA